MEFCVWQAPYFCCAKFLWNSVFHSMYSIKSELCWKYGHPTSPTQVYSLLFTSFKKLDEEIKNKQFCEPVRISNMARSMLICYDWQMFLRCEDSNKEGAYGDVDVRPATFNRSTYSQRKYKGRQFFFAFISYFLPFIQLQRNLFFSIQCRWVICFNITFFILYYQLHFLMCA